MNQFLKVLPVKLTHLSTRSHATRGAMLKVILFPILLWTHCIQSGLLRMTSCSDQDCRHGCQITADYVEFDNVCRSKGAHFETKTCESDRMYTHKLYATPSCDGEPVDTIRTGMCYQDGGGGSYYYSCNDGGGSYGSTQNDTSDSQTHIEIYVIGTIITLLVFLCGINFGYLLYKKGENDKINHQSANVQTEQLTIA